MTKEQLQLLLEYIDIKLDEKTLSDLGRDTLLEMCRIIEIRKELEESIVEKE
jgi:hypothetical protein